MNQIEETLPEWRDKFLSYKELKKCLKLIEPKGGDRPTKRPRIDASADCAGMSTAEINFIQLLEDELEKFNSFFVEKEEEYIITLKEIQDRVAKAKHSNEEITKIRKEIVDFHGEMVLLENYSALNYTANLKTEKYSRSTHKRTGALMRLPFIQKVLQQPFFTTDLLYKLVKECEITLDQLFAMTEQPIPNEGSDGDEGCDPSTSATTTTESEAFPEKQGTSRDRYYIALRALKEIRSGSSTVSVFSLPPLQISELEDEWKKVPVLEQYLVFTLNKKFGKIPLSRCPKKQLRRLFVLTQLEQRHLEWKPVALQ
ncbi:SPX domain gene 2, partial [Prunus dulcis]